MVLGIDYGRKKAGTALMDERVNFPYPHVLIRYDASDGFLTQIAALSSEHGITQAVFGLPLAADGSDNPWSEEVRRVAAAYTDATGIPVSFADERHTSQHADSILRGKKKKKKKESRDLIAAVLILEAYLRQR